MSVPIDLRSDTVTQPTSEMRRAIAEAEVGDDVFGDDPTVRRLEERVARRLGKEAGLFVSSGTMGNQIAVAAQTRPGDEILIEGQSHICRYEAGAPAVLSGVTVRPLEGRRGLITDTALRASLRPIDVHFPPSTLLVFENTHNRSGGRVLPIDGMLSTAQVGRDAGLGIHLDGARLWNASIASGVDEADYAAIADSVSVCFSKGLGAPVGSVLAGTREMIDRGRQIRKRLGGGMRQVGILAAAALHALDHHLERLVEDHRRARRLAEALEPIPPFAIDLDQVETNIVIIGLNEGSPQAWCEDLAQTGLLVVPFGPDSIRAVTHLGIDDASINGAIERFVSIARRHGAG